MAYTTAITVSPESNTSISPQTMLERNQPGGQIMTWQSPLISCLTTAAENSVIPIHYAIDASELELMSALVYIPADFTAERTLTLAVRVGTVLSGNNIDTTYAYQDFTPVLSGDAVTTQIGLKNWYAETDIVLVIGTLLKTMLRKNPAFVAKYVQIIATLTGGSLTAQIIYSKLSGQYK